MCYFHFLFAVICSYHLVNFTILSISLNAGDEITNIKPEDNFDACLQIPDKPGQWCCVILARPDKCFPSSEACEAICKH